MVIKTTLSDNLTSNFDEYARNQENEEAVSKIP